MNPSSVDLKPNSDFVEDQGANAACTGYAGAKFMDVCYERAGRTETFSPQFLWYQERALTNDTGNDGVIPQDIAQILQTIGVCLNATMPDTVPFDQAPPASAIAEAGNYRINAANGYVVSDCAAALASVKISLAKGRPVCCTFYVYPGFETLTGSWNAMTWDINWSPTNGNIGLHEVLCIGYDDATGHLLFQNQWGPDWGDGGYFGCPYSYLSDPSVCIFSYLVEMTPAGVPLINAGWRPDLTPAQLAVQQAYIAYFGRPADAAGLDYWANIASTVGMGTILDGFAASAESQALYPNAQPAAVIIAAYQSLFNRAPDAPGLAYWSALIESHALTLGGAIYAIMQGALGTDAAAVAAKVEAAGVATYQPGYDTAHIQVARAWLAGIITEAQVQPAVQSLPF